MYCRFCGKEVREEAVVCVHCGCELDNGKYKDNNTSKIGMGVLLCIFLNVIGLIVGLLLYPGGSIARKTFIKGWLITVIMSFIITLLIFGIYYGVCLLIA